MQQGHEVCLAATQAVVAHQPVGVTAAADERDRLIVWPALAAQLDLAEPPADLGRPLLAASEAFASPGTVPRGRVDLAPEPKPAQSFAVDPPLIGPLPTTGSGICVGKLALQ